MRDPYAAKRLAAAISHYIEWRYEVEHHPKVGDGLLEQMRQREAAEKTMRKAFQDATGCTMVYRRGAYTARFP